MSAGRRPIIRSNGQNSEAGTLMDETENLRLKIAALEQKCSQLEENLQQSENRFYKIFHGSSNLIAITTLKDGRIIDLNEASARLGGYTRDEVLGCSITDYNLWASQEERERIFEKIQREGQVHNQEAAFRGKSGEIHKVLLSVDPIIVNGEPCLLRVSVDITAHEEALNNSREYLNQIINRISDPIFVKDDKHRFILANDASCSFLGLSREELLGKSSLSNEIPPYYWKEEEDVLVTGQECQSEDIIADRQGVNFTFMVKKSLLTDKTGNRQIIGVMRDMTEYKRLEAQFLQAQKMEAIGALAGGVAHDFNNLLNVINGYTELVMEDLEQDDPARKDLQQVKDAGKRAAILTSQLLAFGRKQFLQLEILDLNDIISGMASMLSRMIGEDIELITKPEQNLGLVNVDPARIQQIIMNLVVNARDAMPHGGKLLIETANVDFDETYLRKHPMAKAGPYVMLAVSDNGTGMGSETEARIFEPFFTTKEKGKGTGLGLSTVYGIVKQSNGFIWVYSEPGKGTTFKIYFPFVEDKYVKPADIAKPEIEIGGSETVLLVEDEEPVRKLACRILRDRGYNVLEAPDGLEAIQLSQEYKGEIDIVVTDVIMPGISGSTLVLRLRAMRPGIKSLFISGYTGNAIVDHGMLDSSFAFLQKPFTLEGLTRKVREVLNS
jgi:two-component system, cell cycle sensor histidine kinase and response regulator CckA